MFLQGEETVCRSFISYRYIRGSFLFLIEVQNYSVLGRKWSHRVAWVAQPRAWSWGPGIKSHVKLPAWSLLLRLPLSLSLSLSLINKLIIFKNKEFTMFIVLEASLYIMSFTLIRKTVNLIICWELCWFHSILSVKSTVRRGKMHRIRF